jgi:hypothetical protein
MKRTRDGGIATELWVRHKRELINAVVPLEDPTWNSHCYACSREMKKVAFEKYYIHVYAQSMFVCSACMAKNWCRVARELRVGEVLRLWWNGTSNVYACVRDVYPSGKYCITTDESVAIGDVTTEAARIHFLEVGRFGFTAFSAAMEGMSERKMDMETCRTIYYAQWYRAPRQSVGVSVYTLEGKRVTMIEHV